MPDGDKNTSNPDGDVGPDAPRGLRFTTDRQRRIHTRLRHVSPGPLAFYADACRILGTERDLRARSHLAAHLGREIESAIRAVVTGRTRGQDTSAEAHRRSIDLALNKLEFPLDHPVREEWAALIDGSGFHGRAHRENLRAPRPVDEEFETWWARLEWVLDTVLERFEARFQDPLRRAEELAAIEQPTGKDRDRLIQTLAYQPVVIAHFFDSLCGPGWLRVLRREGYMQIPARSSDAEGGVDFSFMPQAAYLARMAQVPEAQEGVTEVLLETPATGHLYADASLLDAVAALPALLAARVVVRLCTWLDEGLVVLVPSKLGVVVRNLAVGGEAAAALDLLGALLQPLADPQAGILGPSARGRFDSFHYWRIVSETVPTVAAVAGFDALRVACDLLETALDLSTGSGERRDRHDGSPHWCPYIGHPRHDRDVRGALVMAVRDAAMTITGADATAVADVVDALHERRFIVFDRIAMHVLVERGEASPAAVEACLGDIERWRSGLITDEFRSLCEARFASVSLGARQDVLSTIKSGPNLPAWRERFERDREAVPTAQDERAFVGSWQRDRLALLERSLADEDRTWLAGLVTEFGPAEDDIPVRQSGFTGPNSPVSQTQLVGMGDDALVRYLSDWREIGGWMEPSLGGLARTLRSTVVADPERFAAMADRFVGLEPDYIAAVFGGLAEAVRRLAVGDWAPTLQLGQWVVTAHPAMAAAGADSIGLERRWSWCRKTLADLIEAGLKPGIGQIPIDRRIAVWAIIEELAEAPDPTDGIEEGPVEPLNAAINTVRGIALHCVFGYAMWVRAKLYAELGKPGQTASLDVMPEVRELMDRRLAEESSPAVRSGFATYFPQLVSLDRAWAAGAATSIFPSEEARAHFRTAAWAAYVAWNGPYTSAFEALRGEYLHAISRLAAPTTDADGEAANRLAEHILRLYAWGIVGFGENDQLVERFLAEAPDNLRAHAIILEGQSLRGADDEIPKECLERLREFWQQRLAAAQSGDVKRMAHELAAFGSWFASRRFEGGWSLARLEQGLTLHPRAEMDMLVVERLAELAPSFPEGVVRCLRLLLEGDERGWLVTRSREHVRAVIERARDSGDAGVREAAVALVSLLLTKGHLDFRDLLE